MRISVPAETRPGETRVAATEEEAVAAASIGQVYRARLHDGRDVAVKVLSTPDDASLRERFLRESRAAAQLRHPHIVGVLDYDVDVQFSPEREWLDGRISSSRVARSTTAVGRIWPGEPTSFPLMAVKEPCSSPTHTSARPLRFAPPQLMGFKGLAVVTDPDIFGAGDVGELFERDLEGKAIWAVPRPGHNGHADYIATSVMLLDCARLTHWDFDQDLDDLFNHRFDYVDWIELKREDRSTIGALEALLAGETQVVHNDPQPGATHTKRCWRFGPRR